MHLVEGARVWECAMCGVCPRPWCRRAARAAAMSWPHPVRWPASRGAHTPRPGGRRLCRRWRRPSRGTPRRAAPPTPERGGDINSMPINSTQPWHASKGSTAHTCQEIQAERCRWMHAPSTFFPINSMPINSTGTPRRAAPPTPERRRHSAECMRPSASLPINSMPIK